MSLMDCGLRDFPVASGYHHADAHAGRQLLAPSLIER